MFRISNYLYSSSLFSILGIQIFFFLTSFSLSNFWTCLISFSVACFLLVMVSQVRFDFKTSSGSPYYPTDFIELLHASNKIDLLSTIVFPLFLIMTHYNLNPFIMKISKEYIRGTVGHILLQIGAFLDKRGMRYLRSEMADKVFYDHKTLMPF